MLIPICIGGGITKGLVLPEQSFKLIGQPLTRSELVFNSHSQEFTKQHLLHAVTIF